MKFKRIMVELENGMIVNITDLPKEQYEYFLKLTEQSETTWI